MAVNGHEVDEDTGAGGGGEAGLEDVGVGKVAAVCFADIGWGQFEVSAVLGVQDAAEKRGRIEPGDATPVDGAVGPDQS